MSGKKLRVKLITIPWELEVPTLTLASIAAVTPEEHFEVCIVDLLRERLVLDEPVDLVGISASVPRIKAAYTLADYYRRRGATVVIGGHHVTALPEEGLQHAHAVVCGEGESSWIKICDQMLTDPALVSGIYRDAPPDLSTLPQPRIDLMKIQRYQPYYYPIIASRGCPQSCKFCFSKRITRGYRTYPIRHVIEQIRRRPKFIKALYFVDDNLAGDMEYTRELFREMRRFNIPFGMQVRHEFSRDPENLRLAREAGCGLISSGFESINQQSLDRTGKRATASAYMELIRNIQGEGMICSGNWMFGFDWDQPEIFQQTWEFIRESEIYHSTFTTEIPFPGTASFRGYAREGRILTTNYDDYVGKDVVVHQPKQMSAEQLRDGIRWLTSTYFSLSHCQRLIDIAWKNDKLFSEYQGLTRSLMLAFLNYYQVWLWSYRMTPSLRWLYHQLLPANKHRYVMDLFRHTNFWKTDYAPTVPHPVNLSTNSPFVDQMGAMGAGQTRLYVS